MPGPMTPLLAAVLLAVPHAARAQPVPAPAAAPAGNPLNPNISVIGSFAGFAGSSPDTEEPAFALREAELAFQAQVDPYSRAEFFIAAGEDGAALEEGLLHFPALLPGLGAKLGRFRMDLGRFNRTHAAETPFADRPLAARRFFGEEGLAGTGVALSYLIPNPLDLYLNLDLEAAGAPQAADVPAFDAARRRDLLYVGRVSGYTDLTEALNLTLGASYAWGPNGSDLDPATGSSTTLRSGVAAADLTVRWKEPSRAIYRSLLWQTELYQVRQEHAGAQTTTRRGGFSAFDWQFARRWHVGGRYDLSQAPATSTYEQGGLAFLTFTPSEFSLVSLQARRTRFAGGSRESVAWLKVTFNIGPHGAHPF